MGSCLGPSSCSFPGNRLPSRGEVLQVFLFHHKTQKEVLFAAAASTAEKVLEVWRRANTPTSDVSWVKKKILKLYEEYGALAKSKSRKTETEEMKRCIFRDSLEDMFDIVHSKAMEAKVPEEDKAFLEAQREDRQSCSMAGVDEKLKRATEEKRRKRQRMEEMKKKDVAASSSTLDRDVALDLDKNDLDFITDVKRICDDGLLGDQQPTFLELSPETWNTDSCFKCAKKQAGVLKVTNDLA
ncbi:hypothetical protein GWK47_004023 [Chionoecetes opilio]|uniref:Uncharacterized protein n=1 Tax=Chionoecetes opilio TaxID=41210 RepID=A0A8J4YNK7_CHIOP|nr:hypothetical protein GWK47_004023 [Chionoecetes opilio]